jgi:hypothetical protein
MVSWRACRGRDIAVQVEKGRHGFGRPPPETALSRHAEIGDHFLRRGEAAARSVQPVGQVHEPEVKLGAGGTLGIA